MLSTILFLSLIQNPSILGPLGGAAQEVVVLPNKFLLVVRSNSLQRSTDGGFTFLPFGSGLPAAPIVDLEQDPSQPQRLLALVGNQVYQSVDSGALWTGSVPFPGPAGRDLAVSPADGSWLVSNGSALLRSPGELGPWTQVATGSVLDPVEFAPSNPQRVYAGTLTGLLRSDDGGLSFVPIGGNNFVQAIGISPLDPNLLLIGTQSKVRRSTNGGLSTTLITSGLPTITDTEFLRFEPTGQGVWYGYVSGLAYSGDTGLTFQAAAQGLNNPPPTPTDLAFGSSGGVFLTTQMPGGLYRAPAPLQPWQHLGFSEGAIKDVLVGGTTGTARIAGALNGVFATSKGGILSPSAYQGDSGKNIEVLVRDPLTPGRFLAGGEVPGFLFPNLQIVALTNEGQSAQLVLDSFGGSVQALQFNPFEPSQVLAGVSSFFAAGFGNAIPGVWRSVNSGASFQSVPGTTGWATRAVAFDPFVPGRVLQLSVNGQWAASSDGGQTWSSQFPAWPGSGSSATLAFDPSVPQRLWRADTGSGWWISNDGGGSWTNLGLSASPDAEVLFVPGQPEAAILGTSNGQVRYLATPTTPSILLYQEPKSGAINGLALDPDLGAILVGTALGGAVELPSAVPFLPLGGASSSSLGSQPQLFGQGLPSLSGGSLQLGLARLPAGAPGLLGISLISNPLPLFGGTLLPALPFFASSPLAADGAGNASVSFPLPNDPNLVGLLLFAQAGLFDPGAPDPAGVSLANALRIKLFN